MAAEFLWECMNKNSYLKGAVENILISEKLVMVSDTVQPAAIHECLAYCYSLGPGTQQRTKRVNTIYGKADVNSYMCYLRLSIRHLQFTVTVIAPFIADLSTKLTETFNFNNNTITGTLKLAEYLTEQMNDSEE